MQYNFIAHVGLFLESSSKIRQVLESLEKISQNNVNLVLLNHTKALYSLFWQYQAQQEFITYQQKNLAITKSLYEYNKSKWDLGTITTQELNTYLSFVYEDSLSLLQLERTPPLLMMFLAYPRP